MPVKYVPVEREVVMYQDVADYFKHPWSLVRRVKTDPSTIARARQRGYFGQKLSWLIWKASDRNIRLTPLVEAEKLAQSRSTERTDCG